MILKHSKSLFVPGFGALHAIGRGIIAAVFAMLMSLGAVAQDADQAAEPDVTERTVQSARMIGNAERARLIIDLNVPTQFAFVTLAEPMALAIDVRAGQLAIDDAPNVPDGFVSGLTFSQIAPDRVRALVALNSPAQVAQAYVLEPTDDQPARLVVDFVVDTQDAFLARAQADLAASQATSEGAQAAPQADEPVVAETRPLILIDPGHGGADGGAVSATGVVEKQVTLEFALALRDALIDTGKFDVALTREDDRWVTLEDRVQAARDNKASLLVSIHADKFDDPGVRGAALYTRDEQATDILDKVLAERENKVDLLVGAAQVEADEATVDILVDLMRREMRRQAYMASQSIYARLTQATQTRRFALRRADFFVLQAPDVPSILLELGFLSNGTDAQNLSNADWRTRTAGAVAQGIVQYFDDGGGK